MIPEAVGIGLAWFLAWLFGQAALHKFGAADFYLQLMRRYLGVVPGGRLAVLLVAALEGITALLLLLPQTRDYGLIAAAVLLLAYAGLMAAQLLRGRADMQCGCAGPDSQLGISWALVFRNGTCAVTALLPLGISAGAIPATWAGLGLAAFVALFAALVYLTSEQIISNAQWMAQEA
ncbi:MAG: MauE/DoxX family redox-associated membrane protein [Halieaceae bacterium]|jgi:hypothetical protein|nr:MauE/DoxX family redox-associated membrane protein [Halieaceae bacterium]